MTKFIMRLILVLLGIVKINSQCLIKDDILAKQDPALRTLLYKGQLAFTSKLFNAINENVQNDNIFYSPYSVYHTLLLAYMAAGGETEKHLKKALEIPEDLDKVKLLSAYNLDRYLRSNKNQSEDNEFISANRLFVDHGLDVAKCMHNFFGSELETLNFHEEPKQSREYINQWISNITKNQITDLIPEDGVNINTKLVLANAAYFKGSWASKFTPERTKKEAFFVSEDKQTLVPFMKQNGTFHFKTNEELGARILELPYKGNQYSMFILLPPYTMKKDGVDHIISKLTPERLIDVVEDSYFGREVILEIPKFTMKRSLPLKNILETMGVGDLFNITADFSTLTNKPGVMFDDAAHMAKVEVNEEGTVAAAATAFFGFRSSRPLEPTTFIANFPFVYIIYEKPTSSVLFMGVFRDPKK